MLHHRVLPVLVIWAAARYCRALSSSLSEKRKTYNYFAFGSNMCSSTMRNLRNITPIASTAAMLPGHELRFNIPGLIGVEPSSAAVEPVDKKLNLLDKRHIVHGTLYKLTEEDFATICRTEGVPFAYSLHRCRVIPYTGDGKRAGQDCLERLLNENSGSKEDKVAKLTLDQDVGISAFTLRAARKEWRRGKDTPPSQSYLNVLIRGAIEFQMDEEYVAMLRNIKPGNTLFFNGLAEEVLRWAERRQRT